MVAGGTVIFERTGTGKTSTIAFVARLLAARGKRILITSYTNSAVDNVLIKLLEKGVGGTNTGASQIQQQPPALVRVGRKSSCHPKVYPFLATNVAVTLEAAQTGTAAAGIIGGSHDGDFPMLPSAESLKKTISSARIVGATALSVPRSSLLVGEKFDVVIVDEAGQINQPAIIGALMAANSFVLVGDHMQLPPLVSSELAEQGGFGVSMLKRLAEEHPDCVCQLTYQYRMNEDICKLSNEIAYKGRLKCGSDSVAGRKLDAAGFPENLPALTDAASNPWLNRAIDPNCPVVFLDTDAMADSSILLKGEGAEGIQPLERTTSGRRSGGSVVNDTEASLVSMIVGGILACGVDASSIGIISPFRAQIRLMEDCQSMRAWKGTGLELSTIDKYQGRDKDIIVLSFVRSNVKKRVGRLLEDFRRLNVALTRAKCKLIMVGSFDTIRAGSTVLKPILERLQLQDRVLRLPANALQCYSMKTFISSTIVQ